MQLPVFQIDAFTKSVFAGNPAAVVPLDKWLPDEVMQSIAAENNLSETAFFVAEGDAWRLRWFTPTVEVDLCGHATLATAHLILDSLRPDEQRVEFLTRSGPLSVERTGELLALNFPAMPPKQVTNGSVITAVGAALGKKPLEVWQARDIMTVYETADDIIGLEPDMDAVKRLDTFAVMATAPGEAQGVDFCSRFFTPAKGISEDPVTGSAHCTLTPYWAQRLRRKKLVAHQLSRRGGELRCEDLGERVSIAGHATLFLEGTIHI